MRGAYLLLACGLALLLGSALVGQTQDPDPPPTMPDQCGVIETTVHEHAVRVTVCVDEQ